MKHVSLDFAQDDTAVAPAGSETRFDLSALLPKPLRSNVPPRVSQFDRFAIVTPKSERRPCGKCSLRHSGRKDWIREPSKTEKIDGFYEKRETIDDVRRRFLVGGADGDVCEALYEAELEWASR